MKLRNAELMSRIREHQKEVEVLKKENRELIEEQNETKHLKMRNVQLGHKISNLLSKTSELEKTLESKAETRGEQTYWNMGDTVFFKVERPSMKHKV